MHKGCTRLELETLKAAIQKNAGIRLMRMKF